MHTHTHTRAQIANQTLSVDDRDIKQNNPEQEDWEGPDALPLMLCLAWLGLGQRGLQWPISSGLRGSGKTLESLPTSDVPPTNHGFAQPGAPPVGEGKFDGRHLIWHSLPQDRSSF